MLNRRFSDFSLAASLLAHSTSTSDFSLRSKTQSGSSDAANELSRHTERACAAAWMISADESQLYYIGAEFEALTGVSCASLYANPDSWIEALHPEDRDRVIAQIEARGWGPHDDERDAVYRLVHPRACARRLRVCSWPVCDDNGTVLFRAGIVIDVTDRGEDVLRGAAAPKASMSALGWRTESRRIQ